MIKFDKVTFSYDNRFIVVKDTDLQLKGHFIKSIIGNSGCGKTTILNLISGLLAPCQGEIFNNETISYLTQTVTLLPYRTALENSLLAIELRKGLSKQKILEAKNLFIEFGLEKSSLNKLPHELSGGMKQRIGIIQSIILNASLFLFDEPFNAIDRNTKLIIQNYIWNKLIKENRSAIIVTHEIEQAILLSDSVLIMKNKAKTLEEYNFDPSFIKLSPEERMRAEEFDKHLVQIIKAAGEIK